MTTTRSPAGLSAPASARRANRLFGHIGGVSGNDKRTRDGEHARRLSLPHPIAVQELNQSAVIFVGHARGGLSADQRSTVLGVAQAWRREATGAISADVPVDTPNAAAAADAFQAARSLLVAAGVPPRAITVHHYHPDNPRLLPVIRLSYTRILPMPVRAACGRKISVLRSTTRIIPTTGSTTISAAPINATSRQ